MATRFKPCSVDGCNGNAHADAKGARGWCKAHYHRWYRYGDPTGGRTRLGEPHQWLRDHVGYDEDVCLIWPFSKMASGYGLVKDDVKRVLAHREMCRLVHGEPPSDEHEAAHSCGNGHLGCVNPKHLRWATHAENMADTLIHGTHTRGERQPTHKLTEAEVLKIRSLYAGGNVSQDELGRRFGVGQAQVGRIIRRERWAWLE